MALTALFAQFALLAMLSLPANAMTFGRSVVRSSVNEALHAEFDLPELSEDEAQTLNVNLASPKTFAESRFEYHPALHGAQLALKRRADGSAYVLLTTSKPIADQFVDLILEARWASGQTLRDYALFISKPSTQQFSMPSPLRPALIAAPKQAPEMAGAVAVATPVWTPAALAENTSDVTTKESLTPSIGAAPAENGPMTIRVAKGDSASHIALRTKTSDVSLEQMLLALMRSNPEAFVQGDLNQLRADLDITVPSVEQVRQISAIEASQFVRAQTKNFDVFRRDLAAQAAKTLIESSTRSLAGSLSGGVQDVKPSQNLPDKLTLSKDSALAEAGQQKLLAERQREFNKNIADLQEIGAAVALPSSAPSFPGEEPSLPQQETLPIRSGWADLPQADRAQSAIPMAVGSLLVLVMGFIYLGHRHRQRVNEWPVLNPQETESFATANQQGADEGPQAPSMEPVFEFSTDASTLPSGLAQAPSSPRPTPRPVSPPRWTPSSENRPSLLTPRLARNQTCSCGSGKKYKDCHGALA